MKKRINYLGKGVYVLVRDEHEHMQKHWMLGTFYETQRNGMLNYIYQHYQGGVFIDCGACIGNHTLFFAEICGSDRIYAFEPVKGLYSHLKENLAINGIENVITFNCALGNKEGEVSMTPPTGNNVGMSMVNEKGKGVILTTLDKALSGHKITEIKLIKIDVEHYNVPLLEGAGKTLTRFKPDVFIECESSVTLQRTAKILEAIYGYELVLGLVFNRTPTYLFKHAG